MAGRGGKRPGAGRPKGSKNTKTREIADKAAAEGITPLEVMLTRMRALWAKTDEASKDQAVEIAYRAAPYMHPRLQSVESQNTVDGELTIEIVKFAPDEGSTAE